LVIALLCAGLYVQSNQRPAVAADATHGLELGPPSSVIAKQALDELWALHKKGHAIPAGIPGISVWSEKYCEALRRENLPKDDYRAKLQAHVDFMEKYANAVIQDSRFDSQLAATDARYAFVRAFEVLSEANGVKPRPAVKTTDKPAFGPSPPTKP
jgi:hypothetical protein